jgi:hypothetical protein
VRRQATRIPGVLTARTRINKTAQDEDFDLVLVVSGTPQEPDEYRAKLAKSARRAELPRAIEVVAEQDAHAFGYK